MWVMQKDVLLRLPDDAPMPPESRKVSVPEDLQRNVSRLRVESGEVVTVDRPLRTAEERLTREDVVALKKLLARERSETPQATAKVKTQERPKPKKEDK